MTTATTAPDDSPARSGRRAIAWVAVVVVLGAALLASAPWPAGAQTTTLPAPPTTLPAENPGSTAAGIVFFGVTAVIILGALILYLRNRRPKVPDPGA
jgi:hypothetical protein